MSDSSMINGRWFFLLLTFFSMSVIADVPTKNGTIPTSEVIDYDNATQIFASYFLNEKLATRFTNELLALPDDLQDSLLNLVVLSNDKFPSSISPRDKHTFAIWLLKAHQNMHEKTATATRRVESLSKRFPELSALLSERLLPRAKAADWTPGVNTDFTPEQKAELTKLKKETAELKKKITSDRRVIDKIDKLRGIGNSITEELKKNQTATQSNDVNN